MYTFSYFKIPVPIYMYLYLYTFNYTYFYIPLPLSIYSYTYIPILQFQIEGPYTLKYFLSMAGPDVISVGSCGEAQRVLKRVEREASHRYQTLTLPEDGAANCIYVNGTLIHRSRDEAPKSDAVTI